MGSTISYLFSRSKKVEEDAAEEPQESADDPPSYFQVYDENNDGKITVEEFESGYERDNGKKPDLPPLWNHLQYDRDGDTDIDLNEYRSRLIS